jgi:hypothetical protein
MKGNVLSQHVVVATALATQTVAAAGTGTGATLSEPWDIGRQASVLLQGGAVGASATATCKVEGQKRSDGNWEALKDGGGTNDLQFPVARLADSGGAIENGALIGSINLADVNAETYKAIRIVFVAAVQDYLVSGTWIISDLIQHPSGQADELYGLARVGVAQ